MKGFFAIAIASLVALTAFAVQANAAPYFVNETEAQGGNAYEYLARIETFREHGTRVHLPAFCKSSCTLYTLLLKDGLVCSRTGDTKLVFHQFLARSVRSVDANGEPDSYWLDRPTPVDVKNTWEAYPWQVRFSVLIRSPLGLPEVGVVVVPAKEVGVPVC